MTPVMTFHFLPNLGNILRKLTAVIPGKACWPCGRLYDWESQVELTGLYAAFGLAARISYGRMRVSDCYNVNNSCVLVKYLNNTQDVRREAAQVFNFNPS